MKTYFNFLEEANTSNNSKNTHITHFEDVVFHNGYKGVRSALDLAIKVSREPDTINISEKFDGSPSVFFGPAPQSGKFFVAKKSIFNKDPKIYFTNEEIQADNKGDLAKKLIYALHFLQELKPREILQGDMLFTKGGVKTAQIDGKGYLTFHPNTLYYGVETDSHLANDILRSKMGIVLHTKWTGSNIQSLVPDFNVSSSDYEKTTNVFIHDPSINGRDIMGVKLEKEVKKTLKLAKSMKPVLDKIIGVKGLSQALEQHHNNLVRHSSSDLDGIVYAKKLKTFLKEKFPRFLNILDDESLKKLIELHKSMEHIKFKIYKHLNKNAGPIKAFVKEHGYSIHKTDIEGFVINKKGHYPLKFVDRAKFSRFNFDDENITKGWTKK